LQLPALAQIPGASAIHSAEDAAGVADGVWLIENDHGNRLPQVLESVSESVYEPPAPDTPALIWSPGHTPCEMVDELVDDGVTISHQA
jgi:hypothetical protein